jgi:hypothetical protein
MFESAELGHTVDKSTYKAEVPALRQALLDAQFDLAEGAQRMATAASITTLVVMLVSLWTSKT